MKRRKLHKCVWWCILKAGQMFQMIRFLLSFIPFFFFCRRTNVLTISCVYPSNSLFYEPSMALGFFSFRRCCVNWSRGRLNWFLNHILWKFTFKFLFAFPSHSRLHLSSFFPSLSPESFAQWNQTPTIYLALSSFWMFLIIFYCFCLSSGNWILSFSVVAIHWTVMENVHKWSYGFINIQSRRFFFTARSETKKCSTFYSWIDATRPMTN